MKMHARTLVVAGAAVLVPAIALADDDQTPIPDDQKPTQPMPPEETPAPQPATPAPTVINNNVPAPQPTYATTEPAPAMEGEEVSDMWNAPLFTTSAVAFGGSYGASIIVAAGSHRIGDNKLYIPVAGPWL